MHKMTKAILPLILALSPLLAFAGHTQEHRISELQEMIRVLQDQITTLVSKQATAALVRAPFTRDLYRGLRNDKDVRALQEFLGEKGFFKEEITGNFFSITTEAVHAFQRAHGLPSTGYFGPMTRAVIARLQSDEDGERKEDEDIGAEGADSDELADSALDSQDSVSGSVVLPPAVSPKPIQPTPVPSSASSVHHFAPAAPKVAEVGDGEPEGEPDDEAEDAGEEVDVED